MWNKPDIKEYIPYRPICVKVEETSFQALVIDSKRMSNCLEPRMETGGFLYWSEGIFEGDKNILYITVTSVCVCVCMYVFVKTHQYAFYYM